MVKRTVEELGRQQCKRSQPAVSKITWTDLFKSGSPAISGDVLAPFETGGLILRLPTPEFLTRCLKTEGVTPDQARAFQAKFWRLHVDSQKSTAKKPEPKGEPEPPGQGRRTAMNQESLSSSVDPDPEAAGTPFKERIRPGMVVRWNPPSTFPLGLPGMNMVVVMCHHSAAGPKARDVTGNLVSGAGADGNGTEGEKYLCAMILPGFMADSYELSMWRHVVVSVDQMEAEVLLEYDAATRYYYMTL